jgi:hypothetical protein
MDKRQALTVPKTQTKRWAESPESHADGRDLCDRPFVGCGARSGPKPAIVLSEVTFRLFFPLFAEVF